MSIDCDHCVECTKNAIGESIAYCEVWDDWRNITLGFCFGNCDMQYRVGEKVVNKPMTNGDRIRAMTDEEDLTEEIHAISLGYKPWCDHHCENEGDDGCRNCILEYLQQSVKE